MAFEFNLNRALIEYDTKVVFEYDDSDDPN